MRSQPRSATRHRRPASATVGGVGRLVAQVGRWRQLSSARVGWWRGSAGGAGRPVGQVGRWRRSAGGAGRPVARGCRERRSANSAGRQRSAAQDRGRRRRWSRPRRDWAPRSRSGAPVRGHHVAIGIVDGRTSLERSSEPVTEARKLDQPSEQAWQRELIATAAIPLIVHRLRARPDRRRLVYRSRLRAKWFRPGHVPPGVSRTHFAGHLASVRCRPPEVATVNEATDGALVHKARVCVSVSWMPRWLMM